MSCGFPAQLRTQPLNPIVPGPILTATDLGWYFETLHGRAKELGKLFSDRLNGIYLVVAKAGFIGHDVIQLLPLRQSQDGIAVGEVQHKDLQITVPHACLLLPPLSLRLWRCDCVRSARSTCRACSW